MADLLFSISIAILVIAGTHIGGYANMMVLIEKIGQF